MEPGFYRHFKGNYYEVLGSVVHSETLETMVLYHPVGSDVLWVRPYAMFGELVEAQDLGAGASGSGSDPGAGVASGVCPKQDSRCDSGCDSPDQGRDSGRDPGRDPGKKMVPRFAYVGKVLPAGV